MVSVIADNRFILHIVAKLGPLKLCGKYSWLMSKRILIYFSTQGAVKAIPVSKNAPQFFSLEIVVCCFACLTLPEDVVWFPKGGLEWFGSSLGIPGLEVEYAAFACKSAED